MMPIGIIIKDQTGNKFIESFSACSFSSRRNYTPISTVSNSHLVGYPVGTFIVIDDKGIFRAVGKE